jgi:hypothetical protein
MYKRIEKIIGNISKDVCDKYNIYKFENYPITQSLDLYIHVQKHMNEFASVDNFQDTMDNLNKIIANPIHVSYDDNKKVLAYYGNINENVCCIVKIKVKKNSCYVATVYPVNEYKLNKAIELSYFKKIKSII